MFVLCICFCLVSRPLVCVRNCIRLISMYCIILYVLVNKKLVQVVERKYYEINQFDKELTRGKFRTSTRNNLSGLGDWLMRKTIEFISWFTDWLMESLSICSRVVGINLHFMLGIFLLKIVRWTYTQCNAQSICFRWELCSSILCVFVGAQ